MAVKLLAPGLVHFHGALELRVGGSNFMFVRGPCGLTVAGRPVRTTQAGVREPHECTEHDDRSGERHCQPGKTVKMAMQRHPENSPVRSEERSVGQECVSTCRSRW